MAYISKRDLSRIRNLVDSIDTFEVECESTESVDQEQVAELLSMIRAILNEVSP